MRYWTTLNTDLFLISRAPKLLTNVAADLRKLFLLLTRVKLAGETRAKKVKGFSVGYAIHKKACCDYIA